MKESVDKWTTVFACFFQLTCWERRARTIDINGVCLFPEKKITPIKCDLNVAVCQCTVERSNALLTLNLMNETHRAFYLHWIWWTTRIVYFTYTESDERHTACILHTIKTIYIRKLGNILLIHKNLSCVERFTIRFHLATIRYAVDVWKRSLHISRFRWKLNVYNVLYIFPWRCYTLENKWQKNPLYGREYLF